MLSSMSSPAVLAALSVIVCVYLELVSAQGYRGQHAVRLDTLYRGNEPVVQLHANNYTDFITGKSHAWVVQFYATWCGHCQRFAPTWKSFANDLRDWWPLVKVAAVACSHPDNAETCRHQEITSYPSVRFFQPMSEEGQVGERYGGSETVPDIKRGVVDFVTTLWEHQSPANWPSFTLLKNSEAVDGYIQGFPKRIILFQDETADSHLGQEVILDLSTYREDIEIMRASKEAGASYGVTSFPSIYHSNPDGSLTSLSEGPLNRQQIVDFLKRYSGIESIHTTSTILPDHEESLATRLPAGVHMQDLESCMYIFLWQEVAKYENLSHDTMAALKTYIHILAMLLPSSPYVQNYMRELDKHMDQVEALSAEAWLELLEDIQASGRYIPKRVVWTGCEGSIPTLRGYPCSLWTTFHTLTVSVLDQHRHRHRTEISSLDVLLAVRGFVKYFFGCGECSRHFLQGSTKLKEEVTSNEGGVLWLWRKHNVVNHHLSGDSTEDPRHPKMQFPLQKVCPDCYQDGDDQAGQNDDDSGWNTGEVLHYLQEFYGADSLIEDQHPYNFTSPKGASDNQPFVSTDVGCTIKGTNTATLVIAQYIFFVVMQWT